jgi:hypothetical protein
MSARAPAPIVALAAFLWAIAAHAMPGPTVTGDGQSLLCRNAVQQAEIGSGLPAHLLAAIARVESGRFDPISGHTRPWPWTINAEGAGTFFETKSQAVAFVRQLRGRGVQSIDVGCMQINLMHHPDAFRDLEEAFDPVANAKYAVKFLTQLRGKTGSWELASAWYHSAVPQEGGPYREKVVMAMSAEAKEPASPVALLETAGLVHSVSSMPMPGMLSGHGNIMLLPRPTGGTILAQPNASATTANSQVAATSTGGRGLESYRMQPVRVVRLSLVTFP